jgi:hypothetical protein
MTAEVLGADNLARGLRKFADGLPTMDPKEAGRIMLAAAKERAPVKSGNLRASGSVDGAGVKFTAPYAPPIHWGWRARNITPNRFALEGARATEGAWLDVLTEDIQAGLDKIKGV